MKSRWKISLYAASALMFCALPAWGQQNLFGDSISGYATACTSNDYNKLGKANSGYEIKTGVSAPDCEDIGSATGESGAKIGPPVIGTSATSVRTGDELGGTGEGQAVAFDTAYLIPPDGYSEDTVQLLIKTKYTFNLSLGEEASSTTWGIQWYANSQLIKSESSEENGSGTLSASIPVTVTEGGAGFQLILDIEGASSATFGGVASFETGNVTLELPEGWAYTWASQ